MSERDWSGTVGLGEKRDRHIRKGQRIWVRGEGYMGNFSLIVEDVQETEDGYTLTVRTPNLFGDDALLYKPETHESPAQPSEDG